MTRINLVEPHQLTNKHLMAEYRELPRIFTAVLKLQAKGKTPDNVDTPDHYVLGKGHVKFFYDKIGWLRFRYKLLCSELLDRDFDLDKEMISFILLQSDSLTEWYGTYYKPTPEEIYLNMVRICKRSNLDSVAEELYATEYF